MSFGGGKSQSTTDTRLAGISVNQSTYGNAIPLLYGKTRASIFLLDYVNFISTPHTQSQSGGKGGGGGSSNTTFTYSASLVMGVCEGQVNAFGAAYQDKVVSTPAGLGLTTFSGAGGQAVWSYLTSNFPTHAIPYDHTAYVAIANFQMGGSAAIPNFSFEITGLLPYSFGSIDDAEPSAIIVDYCTDPNHGAAFSGLNTSQFQGAGATTWQTYCIAMGFFLSPYEDAQRAAVDFIKEILQITNSDAWTSAGLLNILSYADTAVTGNSRTYTPNLTPVFAFAEDDLRPPGSSAAAGSDPIIIDRKPLADTYNTVVVEYLDRSNAYNIAIAQATDAQDILNNGVRVMPTLTFHSITTGPVAQMVAQLILQRQLYIRNQFTFSVRADYCLLEPMDLVSITDTALGILNKLVRIIEVDDDENDNLTIIAEDMLVGSATAPSYNFQGAQGFAANYGVTPPSVATPLIFSAPPALVGNDGGYEMWICVDQGAAGSWGGCDVYSSLDGVAYTYMGTMVGASRYGTLTASLASHADPDTVDTLAVVFNNPATTPLQLVSGSAADYNNLRTLMYVDGEIIAYQTVALTSAGNYNITNLRRGQYGSVPALHASASSWARIDGTMFRMPYDPGMMGQTMHFKFCSYNLFGRAYQSLGSVTDYTHVLSSTNAGQLTPGPLTLAGHNNGVTINGNSAFKSSQTPNFNADLYSLQGYTNGSFASFVAPQVFTGFNLGVAMGLKSSQSAFSAGINDIDFAIVLAGGNFQVFESGASKGSPVAYVAGDLFAVQYDGAFVRYYRNSVQFFQSVAAPNITLYLGASYSTVGGTITSIQFGPYGTATPVLWIPRGLCQISDEAVIRNGGAANTWDSDAYSINGYSTAHIVWKANQTNKQLMVGFSAGGPNLTSSGSTFVGLSYALFCDGGTGLEIYESGTHVSTPTTYTTTDFFALTYDGATLTYWKNGTALRTVSVAGLKVWGGVCMCDPGAAVNSLEFGPGSNIPVTDTAEMGSNAATGVSAVAQAGPTTYTTSGGGVTSATPSFLPTVSVGAPIDNNYVAVVTMYFEGVGSTGVFTGGTNFNLQFAQTGNNQSGPSYSLTTTRLPFTIQEEFTCIAGQTIVISLQALPGLSQNAVFNNFKMQVELVKR